MQLAAGDGAFDQRTRGTLVGIEVAGGERVLAGLHVHVDAAAGPEGEGGDERERGHRSVELRSTGRPMAAVPTCVNRRSI